VTGENLRKWQASNSTAVLASLNAGRRALVA